MQFAAALSQSGDTAEAAEELSASLRRQLPGKIDLLAIFLSADHRDDAGLLAARLLHDLSPRILIGCTCEGVIGGDREIERASAVSALAGSMPGVSMTPFHIGLDDWETLLAKDGEDQLSRRVGLDEESEPTQVFLLLGDPYTTPLAELMEALEDLAPGIPSVGGLASGGHAGENVLLLDGDIKEDGVVGIRFGGPIRIETIVSQGCRPIGDTLLVTQAAGNMIGTLGGRSALEVAREILSALPPEEQELAQNGLYLGVVVNEYQPTFERGDFLVRNVLGADMESGALAVGDTVRAGQTVQFQVRDKSTADEDLRMLMAKAGKDEVAPTGGLLFSCNGRGVRLFDLPNHDVRGVLEAVPETPIAGFFAAGEIGPVGGKSFLHGHTASILLFREQDNGPWPGPNVL